jgi:hypothetical protein
MRSDSSLKDYYEALRARGESHPDAKVALARKIASLALSLLKIMKPITMIGRSVSGKERS